MAKKLFLGIHLNTYQRQEISQLQSHFSADVMLIPITHLHMTLAFFGLVSNKTQRKLEKRISALRKPVFSITLNQLTHWKKAKILCISGEAKDNNLLQLVKECQLLAAALNLPRSKHVFKAHITVARKAQQLPELPTSQQLFKALLIKPKQIHLFESKSCNNGVEYRILRSWPLHKQVN